MSPTSLSDMGPKLSHICAGLKSPLFMIILLGLAIRLILAPLLTYTFDFNGWALVLENIQSGNGLYDLDGYYYSPPWGYVLAIFSKLTNLLGLAFFGEQVVGALSMEWYGWYFDATASSPEFNLLLKIPLILMDLVAGYLIYWLVSDITEDKKKATLAFAIWFICPFVITVGCIGGQFDSLSAIFTLLTIIFLRRNRYLLAGMTFSLAFLTKLFPAILVFVFVAYIHRKHSEEGKWVQYTLRSVIGFALATVVILLPNIIQGNIGDCFAFLTNRVSNGLGGATEEYMQYLTVVAYLAIAGLSAALAWQMARSRGRRLDRDLLFFCLLTTTVLFLYPSTPQYMLLLFPFMILWYVLYDRSIKGPILLMMVGTTLFSLASNFTLLLSLANYTDLLNVSDLMRWVDMYQQPVFGLSLMGWQYYLGGVLQWVSVVWLLVILLNRWKTERDPAMAAHNGIFTRLRARIRGAFSRLSHRQRHYLMFCGAYAVASVFLYTIVRLTGIPSSVFDGYFPYADAMMNGIVPYTEEVFVYGYWSVWEYPPLAYIVLFIPRLFASGPEGYQAAFIVMTFIVFTIGLYFSERIAKDLGRDPFKIMLLYTVAMMLMFEFQVDRFDIVPAVLTIVTFSLFIRKQYEYSFVLLAVGTLVKLFPMFLVPVLLIYLLSIHEYRRAKVSFAVLLTTAAVILGAVALVGSDPFIFLDYHTERPLEIESLAASVISFLGLFLNLNLSTEFSFGSDNIVGPLPDSIASVILMVAGGLMIMAYATYAYFASERNTEGLHDASITMLMVLLIFMLFSTVFSGQYLIWAVPSLILCVAVSKNKQNSVLVVLLFVVAEVLTQINFAVNFGMRPEGMDMSVAGTVIVLLRNLVLLYLLCVLSYLLTDRKPPVPKRLAEYLKTRVAE